MEKSIDCTYRSKCKSPSDHLSRAFLVQLIHRVQTLDRCVEEHDESSSEWRYRRQSHSECLLDNVQRLTFLIGKILCFLKGDSLSGTLTIEVDGNLLGIVNRLFYRLAHLPRGKECSKARHLLQAFSEHMSIFKDILRTLQDLTNLLPIRVVRLHVLVNLLLPLFITLDLGVSGLATMLLEFLIHLFKILITESSFLILVDHLYHLECLQIVLRELTSICRVFLGIYGHKGENDVSLEVSHPELRVI